MVIDSEPLGSSCEEGASMPKPVPIPVRKKLLQRAQQGEATASLATAFGLAPRTVRHLLKRFRDRGPDAVRPDYHMPKPLPQTYAVELREAALAQRRTHPTWGAVLIRIALREQRPEIRWPSPRTLRRWFRQAGLGPAPKGTRPHIPSARATAAHQSWQMDASERIPLADGRQVCWLRIVDEATGAVLQTAVFPPSLLESGGTPRHPNGPAQPVFAVGSAGADARRQRATLGLAGRPADRLGLLAGGPGGAGPCQPAPPTAGQRRGGAVSGHRQVVGGAGPVCLGGRVATAPGCGGSLAAGVVSRGRGAFAVGGLSRLEALGAG